MIIVWQCTHGALAATQGDTLRFRNSFKGQAIFPGATWLHLDSGDSLQIETLRYYISAIQLHKGGQVVWTEANSYHLLDAGAETSMQIPISVPPDVDYDQISFQLGIDSATNVAGALGGDLDPTKGMYWTWQSGYINFKLEGMASRSTARNREYQFHLGGYQAPFLSMQLVSLPILPTRPIQVSLELERFLNELDLSSLNHVMSPSAKAVALSRSLANSFIIQAP